MTELPEELKKDFDERLAELQELALNNLGEGENANNLMIQRSIALVRVEVVRARINELHNFSRVVASFFETKRKGLKERFCDCSHKNWDASNNCDCLCLPCVKVDAVLGEEGK